MRRLQRALRHYRVLLIVGLLALAIPFAAAASGGTLVTVGSPPAPFSQNKQNEPGLAIDPVNTQIVVAGSNDNIDMEACNAGDDTTCPFTEGVGVSGVYFSFNGGSSWIQPTYTGWSARNCLGTVGNNDPECQPIVGPIGTLPWYYENGLKSDGDPSLSFGPMPGQDGTFSWANGVRLYYANLTANFSSVRSETAFKGFEAVAVSRMDNPSEANVGNKSSWMPPVIVTKQNSALFSDHEQVWADNAASSPYFGNVYVCSVAFRGQELSPNSVPEPVTVARSTDGGKTWKQKQLTAATDNGQGFGRQDCGLRTDSQGTLYVVWQGGNPLTRQNTIFMARSFNGGQTFERPRAIGTFEECGQFDPVSGLSFDGILGARTGSFPTIGIANAAPSGTGATDRVVVAWCSGPTPTSDNPGPNERVMVISSTNHGNSFSSPVFASPATDRPDMPAVAISPNGSDVYLVYDNFLQPYQLNTTVPRLMQGVVRHASFNALASWTDVSRESAGDARASTANSLADEFIGDYNNAATTNDHVVAVWNDVRNGADCPAVDAYRASLLTESPLSPPAVQQVCPANFGNSDIFSGVFGP